MITITPIPGRKVIALDPATSTGAAWTDGSRIVIETWRLAGSTGDKINQLQNHLRRFITRHGCNLIGYEESALGAHGRGGKIQHKTIAFHNQIRGAIEAVGSTFDIECWHWAPPQIKALTANHGRASKEQMMAAVKSLYGVECRNDDEADATAIAMLMIQGIEPKNRTKKKVKAMVKKAEKLQARLW